MSLSIERVWIVSEGTARWGPSGPVLVTRLEHAARAYAEERRRTLGGGLAVDEIERWALVDDSDLSRCWVLDAAPLPLEQRTGGGVAVASGHARTVEDVARLLGHEHLDQDVETKKVFWSPHESEVRLVEITTALQDDRDVLPFKFAPELPDVPYPSVVVLLGPGDGEAMEAGKLALPEGWAPLQPLCGRFWTGRPFLDAS